MKLPDVKYLLWKTINSQHNEFDIYAPTKQERKLIEPILKKLECDEIEVTLVKVHNKIKGFKIKIIE